MYFTRLHRFAPNEPTKQLIEFIGLTIWFILDIIRRSSPAIRRLAKTLIKPFLPGQHSFFVRKKSALLFGAGDRTAHQVDNIVDG